MSQTVVTMQSPASAERQPDEGGGRRFKVADVMLGKPDARGVEVEQIYALRSDEYVIYRAGDVYVQFADTASKAEDQRKRVLDIGEARADLAALLVGWPPQRRKLYDCKTAMALQSALDNGDVTGARKIIEGARDDARNERSVAGRLQYLAGVVVSCLALGALLSALGVYARIPPPISDNVWVAGQAGLLGAAFSVVLAIKGRTVALDTNRWGNVSDGFLRLMIGLISGGFLLLLLGSGMLPKVGFGTAEFSMDKLGWKAVVVLGFVAGFIERMVPDLLNKAHEQAFGAPAQNA